MSMKQKICNTVANLNDYEGFHFTADVIRKTKIRNIRLISEIVMLYAFPIIVLIELIFTRQFHKPKCNCKDYRKYNRN